MELAHPHRWDLPPVEAQRLQQQLASLVRPQDDFGELRWIAGLEVAHSRFSEQLIVAVALVSYPDLVPVVVRVATAATRFPFIPDLVSFREVPAMIEMLEGLPHRPDLVIVGGPGVAHGRNLGVASHLGVVTGLPTIGCSRSTSVGSFVEPEVIAGSTSALVYQGEIIGTVFRSKNRVAPLFVSSGHRVSRETSARLVREGCHGYRLPEPLRLASQAIASTKQNARSAEAG